MAEHGTLRILLVEDDTIHARIIHRALQREGEQDRILHLADGRQLLAFLERIHNDGADVPDLILLDLCLPEVDGFDLIKAIRSREPTRRVPIIVISTSDRPNDIDRSYALGANAYLSKPADFDAFEQKLSVLRRFWADTVELPAADR